MLVAMKGTSFCTSAAAAIGIIVSNAAQVAVVETVTSLLFAFGKCFIVASAGLLGFLWLDRDPKFQEGTRS